MADDDTNYEENRVVNDDANPKDALASAKPDLALVPPVALVYESMVMALGARKYGAWNWRSKKVRAMVYLAAMLRHIMAAIDGEDMDEESKQYHIAHARACTGIYLDALATGNLIDDRPTPGAAGKVIVELTEKKEAPTALFCEMVVIKTLSSRNEKAPCGMPIIGNDRCIWHQPQGPAPLGWQR